MLEFRSLPGLTSYAEARALQLELVEARGREEIPDTFLFLEHEPVITQGRGLQFTGKPQAERHMPVPAQLPSGIAFCESERGGDLTYHGPGQLVVYPICKLDGQGFGPHHDISAFLRKLERAVIQTLSELGIAAGMAKDATGVWVGEEPGAKKIASIGIAVRRWVTYHGLALNCVNDLKPFHLISPCGFSPEVMTRIVDLLPVAERAGFAREWRTWMEGALARVFMLDDSQGVPRAGVRPFREPSASL